jgi:transcriptional regulator with XRE-family HTH domain
MEENGERVTLNDIIKNSGYTWEELAVLVGVKRATLGRWAHSDPSKRISPPLDRAIKLAIALGIDIKTLAKVLDLSDWDKLP